MLYARRHCSISLGASRSEARIVIESRRRPYHTVRPHGSLGDTPPAPEVFVPAFAARTAALPLAPRPTLS